MSTEAHNFSTDSSLSHSVSQWHHTVSFSKPVISTPITVLSFNNISKLLLMSENLSIDFTLSIPNNILNLFVKG